MKISHFKKMVQALALLATLCIISMQARRGGVSSRAASLVSQAQAQVVPANAQQPVATDVTVKTSVQPVTVGRRGASPVAAPVINQIATKVTPTNKPVTARGVQVVSSVVNPVEDKSQDQAAALQQQMANQIQQAQATAPATKAVTGRGVSSRGVPKVLGGAKASDVTTAQKSNITKSITAPIQDTSQAQAAALQQQMANQIQQAQATVPVAAKVAVGRGASSRGTTKVLGNTMPGSVSTAQKVAITATTPTDTAQNQAIALQQQMANQIKSTGRGSSSRGMPTPTQTVVVSQPTPENVIVETPRVTVETIVPKPTATPSRPGSRGLPQPTSKITAQQALQQESQKFTIDLNQVNPIFKKTTATIAAAINGIQKKTKHNKFGHFITQEGKGLGSRAKEYLNKHKGTLVSLKQGKSIGNAPPEVKKEYEKILKYIDVADLVKATGEPFPDASVKQLYLNDPSASAVATAATGMKFTGATAMQAAQGGSRSKARR